MDIKPILIEVAGLSSDLDRYGMGSTRQFLLAQANDNGAVNPDPIGRGVVCPAEAGETPVQHVVFIARLGLPESLGGVG